MLRICAALVAAVPVAALSMAGTASAKELKPKFGDIDGVYYTDVAENREACRRAVQRKIYLCGQNTSFVSNTEDRKYPGCLPIFRRQAGNCADHFRSEAYKCQGAGAVRIADFTGFACTVTATVVEEGDEPERSEPERSEPEDGTGAREPAQQDRSPAAHLSPKCAGMSKGAKCWHKFANKRSCYIFAGYYNPSLTLTWSGACSGGIAVGRGMWRWQISGRTSEGTGMMVRGKPHGRWVWRHLDSNGHVSEGPYVDGKRHGRWVDRFADGGCLTSRYNHGERASKSTPC